MVRVHLAMYQDTGNAHELAIRQHELYVAMQIVESCGAHPLLTDAVVKLGARLTEIQGKLRTEIEQLAAE